MLKFNHKSFLLSTVALAMSAVPALAQLDEVVVTAEKRTTNLQDTPIAITAISEEALTLQQVTNIKEISALAPNLNIKSGTTNNSAALISIRGIGMNGDEFLTQDVPNGFYIDGVPISKSAATAIELADIEQVEVLRGPQGTLFGRNSIGGAVSFKTKRPADEVGGRLELGIGNYGYQNINAKVNLGHITENLKASIALGQSEREGLVDNLLQSSSRDPGAYDNFTGRIALELDVTDSVNAYYTYDFSNSDSYANYYQMLEAGTGYRTAFAAQTAQAGCPDFTIHRDRQEDICVGNIGASKNDTEGHMLNVDIDLGGMTLRSVSGYRDWAFSSDVADVGGFGELSVFLNYAPTISTAIYAASSTRNHTQFTQEFTLISEPGDKFDWVAGIFYLDEDGDETGMEYFWLHAFSMFAGGPSPTFTMESESKAVYGQLTYHATPILNVTVGGRYTRDELKVTQPSIAQGARSQDSSEPTGHITVDYAYSDNINTYAKISRGYRAGGFAVRGGGASFDPETATAYEIGVKTQTSDNRIRFNAALFSTDYKDRQIIQPDPSAGSAFATRVINASEQSVEGVEFELQATLTDKLSIEAAYGFAKAETDGFMWNRGGASVDIGGELLHSQPENTANIALTYKDATEFGDLTARIGAVYESDYYSFGNFIAQTNSRAVVSDAHTLVNGQLRLDNFAGTSAYIMLWGKNLTEEEYIVRGIDFAPSYDIAGGYWNDPRTFGLNIGYNF